MRCVARARQRAEAATEMGDIFLSYRRQDSASASGRLADRLHSSFGAGRVFRDHESIVPGADYAATLQRAIGAARVVLAVVGPGWLRARDARGRRRLDDPDDLVRREIAAALASGIPVLPVLVEGGSMPDADSLPPQLRDFTRCQAIALDDASWAADCDRLVAVLVQRYGIEAAESGADAAPATLAWRRAAGELALDLFELLAQPRRLILRRAGSGSGAEVLRAMLLMACCLMLGNLLLASALDRPLAIWLFDGTLLIAAFAALLWAPLVLAWRLAGWPVGARRVAAVFALLVGGAWVFACAGALLMIIGVRLVDFGAFDRALELLKSGPEGFAGVPPIFESVFRHGRALALFIVANVVWLAGIGWLIVGWGAFRIAFGAGRRHAALATLGWLAMLAVLVAAARWAAAAA